MINRRDRRVILANEILHGSVTDLRFIKRTIGFQTYLHDIFLVLCQNL